MIYTGEQIVDPLGFIKADSQLVAKVAQNGFEIISGPDIDALVTETFAQDSDSAPIIKQTCEVLGSLYMEGYAWNTRLHGGNYTITWYPSPTYCNQLSERLGRRLGEDVLRFCHSPYDQIPSRPYLRHNANGENPQSTGPDRFTHDRDRAHAPGVILSPAFITQARMQLSADAFENPQRPSGKRVKSKEERIADALGKVDRSSGYVAEYGVCDLARVRTELEAGKIPEAFNFVPSISNMSYGIWREESHRQEAIKGRKVKLAEIIIESMLDLLPHIHQAQQEMAVTA